MDHTRDNPLKRFTAFWIAILLVFCFGVALILLRPLTHRESDSAEDLVAAKRLEVKSDIDRAQAETLNDEALSKAVSEKLTSFAGDTVQKGAMPIPGTAPAPAPAPAGGEGGAPSAEAN